MRMDSPIASRDVVAEYHKWHKEMGAGSGDPLRLPWYASVVEEFGSCLTGEVLLRSAAGVANSLTGWLAPLRTFA